MNKTLSNKELIQGCIDKSRLHQESLYRKFCPQMIRLGYRFTKDQELIISWVNNGFLKVFNKIQTLRGQDGEQLGGWIRTIVYRTMIDGVRKEKKYWNNILVDELQMPNVAITQHHYFEYDDIINIIDLIPEKSKAVFNLFALQGYSHEEIGEQLNISAGTSKWHLHSARKKIQALLQQRQIREQYG